MPLAGGYFDQPLQTMQEMNAALNVYSAYRAVKQAGNMVKFSELYPRIMELVGQIEKLRQEDDD